MEVNVNQIQQTVSQILASYPTHLVSAFLKIGDISEQIDPEAGLGKFQVFLIINQFAISPDECDRLLAVVDNDYCLFYMVLRQMNLGIMGRGELMHALNIGHVSFGNVIKDLRYFLKGFNEKKARRLSHRSRRHRRAA